MKPNRDQKSSRKGVTGTGKPRSPARREKRGADPPGSATLLLEGNASDRPSSESIRVLLVEDDHGDAELIRGLLMEACRDALDLTHVTSLPAAIERLSSEVSDVVLLDLTMPESKGLDTLEHVRRHVPGVPIVVLTGSGDSGLASHAVRRGAQDYLVKGEASADVIVRAIRYAIERVRLVAEVEEKRQQEQGARELTSLARLSAAHGSVAAGLYSGAALRQALPERFETLVARVEQVLRLALEQRAYKVNQSASSEVESVAQEIGFLQGKPRDVIDIYSTALKNETRGLSALKARACVEEGRLIVLELMGCLASFYRWRSWGTQSNTTAGEAPEQGESGGNRGAMRPSSGGKA